MGWIGDPGLVRFFRGGSCYIFLAAPLETLGGGSSALGLYTCPEGSLTPAVYLLQSLKTGGRGKLGTQLFLKQTFNPSYQSTWPPLPEAQGPPVLWGNVVAFPTCREWFTFLRSAKSLFVQLPVLMFLFSVFLFCTGLCLFKHFNPLLIFQWGFSLPSSPGSPPQLRFYDRSNKNYLGQLTTVTQRAGF